MQVRDEGADDATRAKDVRPGDGHGMGLAICRGLLHAEGGDLKVYRTDREGRASPSGSASSSRPCWTTRRTARRRNTPGARQKLSRSRRGPLRPRGRVNERRGDGQPYRPPPGRSPDGVRNDQTGTHTTAAPAAR